MRGLIPALGRTFMRVGCFVFGEKESQLYMGQVLVESAAMASVVGASMMITCEGEEDEDDEDDEDLRRWVDDAAKGGGKR